MATYTFDGPNTLITVSYDGPVTYSTPKEMYSDWKEWVKLADNAKYFRAFMPSVGGNPLGGGTSLDGYFFLNNTDGWRIKPAEADGELRVDGNLFGVDPNTAILVPPVGDFQTLVTLVLTSRALVVETGVSGLTVVESTQLGEIHGWSYLAHIWNKIALFGAKITKRSTDAAGGVPGTLEVYDPDTDALVGTADIYETEDKSTGYRGRGIDHQEKVT